ncbi:hypothetical protein KDM41_16220 [bacterium]|nr:hypothetical protein [bacterium]
MTWTDHMEYGAFRLLTGALAGLPTRWTRAAGRGVGRLAGDGLRVRRRVVDEQLSAVLPELPPQRRVALRRAVYAHLGETLVETFCLSPAQALGEVRVVPGWGELDEAVADGRGVIVVTAHLGNFELGGRVLARRFPVLDVIKPMRNPLFDRHLERLRARFGIATVPMDHAGRTVLAHLRRGGVVTLLVDQDAGAAGLRTPFLGRPASTWPGAARLALRTGAPLVPVAIVRGDDGGHVLHIGRRIAPPAGPADAAAVAALTARISAAVETFISRDPGQWFWVHRRWKGAEEAHGC